MLTVKNLTYSYGKHKRPVLENFSLSLEKGTVCGLLGRNGAGKSTLLYLITGLLKPKCGTIDYNGFTPWNRNVNFLNDVFLVPEEFVLPNVKLSEFLNTSSPFYPKFSISDFNKILNTFELSPEVHLGQLSMGQKKRVFISFALACNTSLLILDEPTNGLDIPGKRLFRKVYDVDKILDHVIITDTDGVLLDSGMSAISSRLSFSFTTNKDRAEKSLISLDAPGGYNIIEYAEPDAETDVNLESLFEFTRQRPSLVADIFRHKEF